MASQPITLSSNGSNGPVLERELDESIYPEYVVLRAVHALAPLVSGVLERPRPGLLKVELRFSGVAVENAVEVRSRFEILLNDFLLRKTIEQETFGMRRLIVAQAFDRANLQYPEFDDSDPATDALRLSHPDPETGRRHE